MATVPQQWVEKAQYDLDTAKAMLESGRYLYVVFCCQQAVEKALKGLIALRTGETPPRLHNLPRLAEVARLEVAPAKAEVMRFLTSYYVQSRYPEELALDAAIDASRAEHSLRATEEIIEWPSGLMR